MPLQPNRTPHDSQVIACSTESRNIDPAEAACRIRQLAGRMQPQQPRMIFKKIDSTLRGNTGIEIVAALEAFNCDAAVINPAFPAMGRIVNCGSLHVPGDLGFRPIGLSGWLRGCGADTCAHVDAGSVAAAIDSGARFVSVDAECDEDLEAMVKEARAIRKRILWVGSAGLACALARHLAIDHPGRHPSVSSRGPVLFCIGSDHPVTVEQERRLTEQGSSAPLGSEIFDALTRGQHVVLRIPRDYGGTEMLLRASSSCRVGALFVCGGDTASLVCSALGAHYIELRREFAPGIPEGILHGGALDGVPVLTKSGGFGKPDDLVRIAEYFHA